MKTESNYFNRDISWLSFNDRVLLEAQDETVPLYERIKFLAIYSSNLDEFYRVRVANIRRVAAINKKKINRELNIEPKQLLLEINEFMGQQLSAFGAILRDDILPKLASEGVVIYASEKKVLKSHYAEVNHYFKTFVMGLLKPVIFGKNGHHPFLNNGEIYLALQLKSKSDQKISYAYLNIPSGRLGRFLALKLYRSKHYFIFLDDIVRLNLTTVFPEHEILECKTIKLDKDADLLIDDEFSGDLAKTIKKQIKKRNLGSPARFLFDASMSDDLLKQLMKEFSLKEDELVRGGKYHNLSDYFQLPNPIGDKLENKSMPAIKHNEIDSAASMFSAIDQKDQMLHFPYHTYDYVLQFFNEAAIDPTVDSIKVTFYRMASNSFIGESLISAAKNGKEVTVFMELKARFDEANNLMWSDRMKAAGVKVIHSMPVIKVHAKVALVRRKLDGKVRHYGFFGTGNLNEKTSKIYADHAMFSCRETLTSELSQVFKFIIKKKSPEGFKHLLVSQVNIVQQLQTLIDAEIAAAKKGNPAHIMIKVNNLEDKVMIDKLYEASEAGVAIELIVRGICCLVPQKEGLSSNITVRRIIDRYLEHARVFIFHNGGDEKVFMGSADWMKRNLRKRIEVVFPVLDEALKQEVMKIIEIQLSDNTKATILDQRLNNRKIVNEGEKKVKSQYAIYNFLKSN